MSDESLDDRPALVIRRGLFAYVIKTNISYSAVAQLVERFTEDRRVASSRLTGDTVLCPCAKHFILCLVLVKPRMTGSRPHMTENC